MNRPLMMFAVYLFVNGAERYLVEMIRVNKSYGSVQLTQAEIIALGLMLSGMVLALFSYRTQQPVNETTS
jgi:prolipoprotein diacylglyceryltransferase